MQGWLRLRQHLRLLQHARLRYEGLVTLPPELPRLGFDEARLHFEGTVSLCVLSVGPGARLEA